MSKVMYRPLWMTCTTLIFNGPTIFPIIKLARVDSVMPEVHWCLAHSLYIFDFSKAMVKIEIIVNSVLEIKPYLIAQLRL